MKKVKFKTSKYWVTGTLATDENEYTVQTPFNRELINEIKSMEGAHWCGYDDKPRKAWTFPRTPRNEFNLVYLLGGNPYVWYERPLVDFSAERPLYQHQIEMVQQGLTYHDTVLACEMGTGKTLAAIEIIENSGIDNWFWIGPRSALAAVQLEFRKWKGKLYPEFFTYERLKKWTQEWDEGDPIPRGVIIDESSRIKNPTAQRSQAVMILANKIREVYGEEGYVIEMSGSPAPKSPADWWHQCEVACPGFLREGTLYKFKNRLSIIVEKESVSGGVYPHLVTWLDDEKKCIECGELKEHENHDNIHLDRDFYHPFKPSKNEVKKLYERMKGLVLVRLKKDCLDLPEKQYKQIICEPKPSTIRAARLIVAKSGRAIQALTLMRELSDGFQYQDEVTGEEKCPNCHGKKVAQINIDPENPDEAPTPEAVESGRLEMVTRPCLVCDATGTVPKTNRTTLEVECPKEDALKDLLNDHEDIGRLVIYAGFTASIDRCTRIARGLGWEVIQVDGRGWKFESDLAENHDWGFSEMEMLEVFADGFKEHPRVAFIGHPESGGTGLSLTSSPTLVYYSNDFKAENRIQSEDRIHRPGMDVNRGATIVDLLHLPTDQYILDNLQKKRELQGLALGEIQKILEDKSGTV